MSLLGAVAIALSAQDSIVYNIFGASRVINGHSVETIDRGDLEFRISHRFGDMFGDAGGIQSFYGIDFASDIRIAFEYGITDAVMVGLGRSKGAGPVTGLLDGFCKFRFLDQKKGGMPVSGALMAGVAGSHMSQSNIPTSVTSYPQLIHRLTYMTQVMVARKFFDRLSLQLMPAYVHRNFVAADDVNNLFSFGGALRYRVNKQIGLVGEYFYNFEPADKGIRFNARNASAMGIEYITNGHFFVLNVTNARGFGAYQYIPYTSSSWADGEFRLGFTITRNFIL